MQLKIGLDRVVDKNDQIDWSLLPEFEALIKEEKKSEYEILIKKLDDFLDKYIDTTVENTVLLDILKKDLFKTIPLSAWRDPYFILKGFEFCAKINAINLIPAEAWSNPIFSKQIKNNESFFGTIWNEGLEFFFDERAFFKNIVDLQETLYEDNFSLKELNKSRLLIHRLFEQLFKDIDWVIPQLKKNPYLYKYLSKDLKINDNVLALTFSQIGSVENPKYTFADIIPYAEIAKEPYVMAAFLTFFYKTVNNYDSYYSYALKTLKSETQVQAVLELLEGEDVFSAVFNHKDFPEGFKQNTSVLLQSLRKSKEIYKVLPEYLRGSKAVVEIMIYEHKAEYLDSKALDYWRQDILTPKLSGPVYEYLLNKMEDLLLLKFVHWRRDFNFIYSLQQNPFEYNVKFSEDDFEVISSSTFKIAKKLVKKFPDFYEVASAEIKCDLDCILEYVQNGSGLFEDRLDYINSKLFYNDELIFEFINADIGDVLLKIPKEKWNSKKFMFQYMALLDNLQAENQQNAFDCLFEFMPEQIKEYFHNNQVSYNFKNFLQNDQLDKEECIKK